MTWIYRVFMQGDETVYAQLEDESGAVVQRYYPLPHDKLRDIPDVANGDEHLPDDDVPAIGVNGFSVETAIDRIRDNVYEMLPEDDDAPVTVGMLRQVLSLIDRDVTRIEEEYQGEPVNRGWNRRQNPATHPGAGPGENPGQGGPP